jgi:hypothetical protein
LRLSVHFGLILIIATSLVAEAQNTGPKDQKPLALIGTWKLNLAKSQYGSSPAPKAPLVHTWWWDGDSLKHKVERLNEKGEVAGVAGQWIAQYDARDHLSGGENESRISLKRIDARTTEMTEGIPGKPLSHFTQVVSPDGKTLVITRKTDGQDGVDVMVHDRQ